MRPPGQGGQRPEARVGKHVIDEQAISTRGDVLDGKAGQDHAHRIADRCLHQFVNLLVPSPRESLL